MKDGLELGRLGETGGAGTHHFVEETLDSAWLGKR
jgi:hypothetical protein